MTAISTVFATPTDVHIRLRFCQLLPEPLSSVRKRKMKYSLLPQQNGNKFLAVMTMTPSVGENPYTLDHEIQFPFISLQKSFETASYCTCHYVTMTTHKPLWFHETLLCTRVILRGTQVFKEVIIPPITASDLPKVFPVKNEFSSIVTPITTSYWLLFTNRNIILSDNSQRPLLGPFPLTARSTALAAMSVYCQCDSKRFTWKYYSYTRHIFITFKADKRRV